MILNRERTVDNYQDGTVSAQFIRTCINARFGVTESQLAVLVSDWHETEWEFFLSESAAEKIQPLLYEELAGKQLLPQSIEGVLENEYQSSAQKNLFLLHELGNVINCLSQAGIEAVVLKGAALLESIYGSIAARPMLDLDLLIRKEQVPKALQLLLEEGYHQDIEPQPGSALSYENELLLFKSGIKPVQLEIHWHLFDSPYFQREVDLDWFWEQARPNTFGSFNGLIFSPEALLLHLFGHLALHHSDQPSILWMVDIAEVLASYRNRIDWKLIVDQAVEHHLVRSLQWSMDQMMAFFFYPQIPMSVARKIESLPVDVAEEYAFSVCIQPDRTVAHYIWTDIALMPGWRAKLNFLIVKLIPVPGYVRSRYDLDSSYQIPFNYLRHWWIGFYSTVLLLKDSILKR